MTTKNSKPADPLIAQVTQAANRAAANLSACSVGVCEAIDTISQSCSLPDTRRSACRRLLLTQSDALKNLASLCDKTAKRLSAATAQLTQGSPQEEVLTELLAISRFMSDQLRSEKENARRVLCALRGSDTEA